MAKFSNAQILAAVINKWASPIVNGLVMQNIGVLPFFPNIESKIRSTGWVSPNWSMACEIAPLVENITSVIIEPMLSKYIANIPDESIPKVAHSVVDNAINNGGLSILEGKVSFDCNDLDMLKRYLNANLPLKNDADYEVIV